MEVVGTREAVNREGGQDFDVSPGGTEPGRITTRSVETM